jgi:6-phosphogluconolactonase (cycloisomerase 2 family)
MNRLPSLRYPLIVWLLLAPFLLIAMPSSAAFLTFVELERDGINGVDGLASTFSVAVSPDGKNVYAAGSADSAIAVFSRNSLNGALTFIEAEKDGSGGVDGLASAYSVTVSPDGKNVYATGIGDNGIAVFSRSSSTGALTFIEAKKDGVGGVDGLAGAASVTVSQDGKSVYVAGSSDQAIAIFGRNATTGALTFVAVVRDNVGGVDGIQQPFSVKVSPDNKHVYSTGIAFNDGLTVFSRNTTTGALTFVELQQDGVGGIDGLFGARSVVVSPDGAHVYVAGNFDSAVAVFSRNPTTGRLTFVEAQKDGLGGVDGLLGAFSVVVSPDNQHLYAAGSIDNAVAVFSRNPTTGRLTFVEAQKDGVGGVDGLALIQSVAVSPGSQHIYTGSQGDSAVSVFRAPSGQLPTPSNTPTTNPASTATPKATPDLRTGYLPAIMKPLPPTATPTSTVPPTVTPTTGPTPTFQPGGPPFGNTLRLDGVDDYASAPDSSNLRIGDEPGESLTIEAWLLADDVTPSSAQSLPIAGKLLDYELYVRLGPESTNNGCVGMILRVGFTSFVIFSRCTTITPGWHHVAGAYNRNNGTVSIYLDGQRVGDPSGFLGSMIYNSDASLHVGGTEGTTTSRPAGRIEELRISDSVRYTGASYTVPKRLTCDAQTRALWHFDEPVGATTMYDGEDGSSSGCGGIEDTLTGINGASTAP